MATLLQKSELAEPNNEEPFRRWGQGRGSPYNKSLDDAVAGTAIPGIYT